MSGYKQIYALDAVYKNGLNMEFTVLQCLVFCIKQYSDGNKDSKIWNLFQVNFFALASSGGTCQHIWLTECKTILQQQEAVQTAA